MYTHICHTIRSMQIYFRGSTERKMMLFCYLYINVLHVHVITQVECTSLCFLPVPCLEPVSTLTAFSSGLFLTPYEYRCCCFDESFSSGSLLLAGLLKNEYWRDGLLADGALDPEHHSKQTRINLNKMAHVYTVHCAWCVYCALSMCVYCAWCVRSHTHYQDIQSSSRYNFFV